jgi:hypothetical protein
MERAGDAMKQIHGKLTPEKVDETMYAVLELPEYTRGQILTYALMTGRNCENKTHSARRSSRLSRRVASRMRWMRRIWRRSSSRCSRNS